MSQQATASEQAKTKPQIVAAIPCLNEERFIGSIVLKTRKHVDSVIVIDDGSSDATAEIAVAAGATVYKHGENRGYGAAIRTALAKGRRMHADVLVILDGDGQHNPNDIPNLIKPLIEDKADIVVGSRFLEKKSKSPFYRRLGQRALTVATNVASGQKVSDSQSGFRAYSAKALKELTLAENGMSASSEMQFAISKSGLRAVDVPIDVSYLEGAKRNPIGHGAGVFSRLLVLMSLRQPLLIFGTPGSFLMVAGLGLGIRVLTRYSETRELAIGNALAMILLLLSGLLALFSGLMLQAMKELMRGGAADMAREMREYTSSVASAEGKGSPHQG